MENESLRTCLTFFITTQSTAERPDKPIYSNSLSTEEILRDKRDDEEGEKQVGGNDYFFQIKNMEASESAAVSDSGKDHIDPES